MNLKIIQLFAKKYSVVTFDVFDTLIERKVNTPSEIFFIAGSKILGEENGKIFTKERIEAEHKAREKKPEHEVTIVEIYKELEDKYKVYLNELMNSEIDTEFSFCYPKYRNIDLLKAFKESGKKIYLISDMYLPVDTIVNILNNCGVCESDYDRIYVSNIYKKNKLSGELFKVCIKENNLNEKKMLHFGDSIKADFIGAHKAGINAWIVGRKNRIGRIFKR